MPIVQSAYLPPTERIDWARELAEAYGEHQKQGEWNGESPWKVADDRSKRYGGVWLGTVGFTESIGSGRIVSREGFGGSGGSRRS